MSKDKYVPRILKPTTTEEAVEKAKNLIIREREGKQLGLKVRWEKVNRSNRKYFRFKQVYLLAGLSGSGKSYLANEIMNDFLDVKGLNKDFVGKPLILYFCYEMPAEDEVIRSLGSKIKISYNRILSAEWDTESQDYNEMTAQELDLAFEVLDGIAGRPLYFFETAGNLWEMEATCHHYKKLHPDRDLIVMLDHTLLSEKLVEKTDIDLMANTGKTVMRIKKSLSAMVIMLGQLNNNIENYVRISDPLGHYPIKSDIYAMAQLYNACDTVIVVHQPANLKIVYYGVEKYPTKDLIHWLVLKARFGKTGSVWLENRLDEGTIVEKDFENINNIPSR